VHIVTYADDLIITGSSPELLENEIKPRVATFLQQRGLELSPEKTRVTQIENGFDFLGHNVRKYNGKLLIKPSTKSVQTLLDKVRGGVHFSSGRAGIATQMRYACGLPRQGFQRRPMPDAMPTRQHTPR